MAEPSSADGGAMRELTEERERSAKMKQENQVLLKKLHDVVGRYRQLQQQYQSLQEQHPGATAAAAPDGGEGAADLSAADQAVKKLEAEKHELIEKLKHVVGTCRIMQKQLQEAKEENEALKSPGKPSERSPSTSSLNNESDGESRTADHGTADHGSNSEALHARIAALEQTIAQQESEKQEIMDKLKEVLGRYQSLQKQLEEKIGEFEATVSKVAALELELGNLRRQLDDASGELDAKKKECEHLRDSANSLATAVHESDSRCAVLREENERIKEQLTSVLEDRQRRDQDTQSQIHQLERENVILMQKHADVNHELEILRVQQAASEQTHLEVATTLNGSLRQIEEQERELRSLKTQIGDLEHQRENIHAENTKLLLELEKKSASKSCEHPEGIMDQLGKLHISLDVLYEMKMAVDNDGHATFLEWMRATTLRIEQLNTELEDAQAFIKEHEAANRDKSAMLEETKLRLDTATAANLELETSLVNANELLSQQKNAESDLMSRLASTVSELTETKTLSAGMAAEIAAMKQQMDDQDQMHSRSLLTKDEDFHKKVHGLEEALRLETDRSNSLEDHLRTLEDAHQTSFAEKEREFQAQLLALTSQNSDLQQAIAGLESTLQEMRKQIPSKDHAEAFRTLQAEFQTLLDDRDRLHASNTSLMSERDMLQLNVSKADTQREADASRLSQLEESIHMKDSEIEELTHHIEHLEVRIEESNNALAIKSTEDSEPHKRLMELQSQYDKVSQESKVQAKEICALSEQVHRISSELKTKTEDYEAFRNTMREERCTLEAECDELKSQLMSLRQQQEHEHASTLASVHSEHETQIEELKNELSNVISKSKEQVKHLTMTIAELEEQVGSITQKAAVEARQLREEIESLKHESDETREELQIKSSLVGELQALLLQARKDHESEMLASAAEHDESLSQLQVDANRLQTDVEELRQALERSQDNAQMYADEIKQIREGLASLPIVRRDNPHSESTLNTGDLEALMEDLRENLRRAEENERQMHEIATATSSLRSELESATADVGSAENRVGEYETEIRTLREQLQARSDENLHELNSCRSQLVQQANELNRLTQELADLHAKAESDLLALTENSTRNLAASEEENSDLKAQIDAAEKEKSCLLEELAKVTDTSAHLQQTYDTALSRLQMASAELESQTELISELRRLNDELGVERQDITAELHSANEEKDALSHKVDEATKTIAALERQVGDKELENGLLTARMEESRSAVEMDAKTAYNKLHEEMECLQQEKSSFLASISQLKAENVVLSEELRNAISSLDQANANIDTANEDIQRLTSQIAELEHVIQERQRALHTAESERSKFELQLQEKTVELAGTNEMLRAQVENQSTLQERLRASIECQETSSEEVTTLRVKFTELSAAVETKDGIIETLRTKMEDVIKTHKKLKDHTKELQDRLTEKINEVSELRESCTVSTKEMETRIERLQTERQEQTMQCQSHIEAINSLEESLRTLREQHSSASQQLTALQASIKALEEERNKLQVDRDQLQADKEATIIQLSTAENQNATLINAVKALELQANEQLDELQALQAANENLLRRTAKLDKQVADANADCCTANEQLVKLQTEHSCLEKSSEETIEKLRMETATLREQLDVESEGALAARTALEAYKKRAATALKKATTDTKSSMKRIEEESTQLQEDIAAAYSKITDLEQEIQLANARVVEAQSSADARVLAAKEQALQEKSKNDAEWNKRLQLEMRKFEDVQANSIALSERVVCLGEENKSMITEIDELKGELHRKTEAAREMLKVKDDELRQLEQRLQESKALAPSRFVLPASADDTRYETISTADDHAEATNEHLANAVGEVYLSSLADQVKSSAPKGGVDTQILNLARAQALRDDGVAHVKKQLVALEEKSHLFQKKYEDTLTLLEESNRQKKRMQELSARSTDGLNVEYLKNVIIKYIGSQNPSEKDRLIPVIATVLHFSPQEMKKINDAHHKVQDDSGGILGGVFSLFGSTSAASTPKPLAIPAHTNPKDHTTGMITGGAAGLSMVHDDEDALMPLNPFASGGNY